MPKCQCKNTINNIQAINMSPAEPSYHVAARPKYSNVAESQENDLKINFMVMIEILTRR